MNTPFPLGRVQQHDPRSLAYPARTAAVVRRMWRRYGNVLDQGNLGSCTGNAGAGVLNHGPFHRTGEVVYKEPKAVEFYSRATQIDPYPGTYPPDDTGSSGLAVAKILKSDGLITGYTHAFGLDHVLASAMLGPLMIGTVWLNDMFYPDASGMVSVSGANVGGHEYVLDGVDPATRRVRFQNSWGSSWGNYGKFWMTFDGLASLLAQGGDAILVAR